MIPALVVALISVYLGYLAREKRFSFCLNFAFILISVFLGIRYMWGNDLPEYVDSFNEINSYANQSIFDLSTIDYRNGKETGWVILNILCKPIGFLGMQILLVFFQNYILYRFVKENVSPHWYWLSLFIYCFGTNYMILSASMLRQFLAMCIFVLASKFIIERKLMLFVILIAIASTIHKSALVLFPCYLIGYFNFRFKVKHLLFLIPIILFWINFGGGIAHDIILSLIQNADFQDLEYYEGIETDSSSGTGLGVIFNYLLLFTLLSQLHRFSPNIQRLSIITSMSFLFIPFSSIIPMVGRIGMYFSIFSIVTYPMLMEKLPRKGYQQYWRLGLLIGFIIITLKVFFDFFYSPIWHKAFFVYHTIFEGSY